MGQSPLQGSSPSGPPQYRRRIQTLPVVVLAAGLLISTGFAIQNVVFNRRLHEQAEIALLNDVTDSLRMHTSAATAAVVSISAMAEASGGLMPEGFIHYAQTLSQTYQLPEGALGLGYARYVTPATKASFERDLSVFHGDALVIRPAGLRPAYAPVTVLEPMNPGNRRAIGFDLLSEPVRRQALLQAAQSGAPVVTGKLQLQQTRSGERLPAVILYSLIRRTSPAIPSPSPLNPSAEPWGWASCPILIQELMQESLRKINNPNLQGSTILVFDGVRPSGEGLLYDPMEMYGTPRLSDPNYQRLSFGERQWLVGVQLTRALPGPDGLHPSQGLILLVGGLLSIVASLVSRELVTSHRQTLEALQQVSEAAEEQAISAAVFEGTVEGVVITNPEGQVISVNQSFTQLTGYTNLDLRGKSLRILRSGNHDSSFYQDLWQQLLRDGSWRHQIWNRCKDGKIQLHDLSITTITDRHLRTLYYLAMYQDVTAKHEEQQTILHQATHDALTGLANRTLLVDRLEQALAMAQRYGYMVGVMFMDLDGFKAVNDNFGHAIGDDLLIAVSKRLQDFLRKTDTLCRQGGDEFVLLLPQAPDLDSLMSLAERIRAAVSQPYHGIHPTVDLRISVSIGISRWPEHGADADALMLAADRAMYQSKHGGDSLPIVAAPLQGATSA